MIRSLVFMAALSMAALVEAPALSHAATSSPNEDAAPLADPSPVSKAERDFMIDAAKGGLTEVQMGQLAMDKGLSPDVKNLGKALVDDHTRMNADLARLAAKVNVTLPQAVDATQRKLLDKLSKESGVKFDRDFTKEVVSDHKKDIDAFDKMSKTAKTVDVKDFATNALPDLRRHLKLGEDAREKAKSES